MSMYRMKAMLLRVGIDKGTDGALGPIFKNGTFEYIPISESDVRSSEEKTFNNVVGRNGKLFSTFLGDIKRLEKEVLE